jgi:hypothetical protein
MSGSPNTTEAVIYDLSDPTHPSLASRLTVPFFSYSYWGFMCGDFWGGYWFGTGANTIVTDAGLVQLETNGTWNGSTYSYTPSLAFLDLRDPTAPATSVVNLQATPNWPWYSLVSDPGAPSGFYLARRDVVDQEPANDGTGVIFTRYRDFAQRWDIGAAGLTGGVDINVPGPLARTWLDQGTRMFLTQQSVYRTIQYPDHTEWHGDTRLNLLQQSGTHAELLDAHTFTDLTIGSLLLDGAHMFVAGQQNFYWWGYPALVAANPPTWQSTSDRLIAFDLSTQKLAPVYDQPTHTYGVQLMGLRDHNLFVSLPGDGVLLTDVSDPSQPTGVRFVRTLGWGSFISFAGDDAYIASGNFGVFDIDLGAPPVLSD